MSPLRTCPKGHRFDKSGHCPTCPQCEADHAPKDGWMAKLGAPARRALERAGITTLKELAKRGEKDVLALHGMGPGSLPKLRSALKAEGLSFRKK
jgi:predicted RecB family nuclease